MIEVRLHGRHGQPVMAFGDKFAAVALDKGKNVQIYDNFKPYRPGAPLHCIIRIDDKTILKRSGNTSNPDIIVVLDNSLMGVTDVSAGLKPGGTILFAGTEPIVKETHGNQVWRQVLLQDEDDQETCEIKVLHALTNLVFKDS